jgi:hypothetical protein
MGPGPITASGLARAMMVLSRGQRAANAEARQLVAALDAAAEDAGGEPGGSVKGP